MLRTLLCSPCHAVIYTAYRECLRCLAQSYFSEQMHRVATECWTIMATYGLRVPVPGQAELSGISPGYNSAVLVLAVTRCRTVDNGDSDKETGITNDPV